MSQHPEVVGLIPAAGVAKRISPLPSSKELFPIGFHEIATDGQNLVRPKVVSNYLLENMFSAGASKVWMVLGKGKWDIMNYYGDGSAFGGHISYLVMEHPWGMPYTLNQAAPWLGDETVLLGMPDTIFKPANAFQVMLEKHRASSADVTLGIFPTDQPQRLCPVVLDKDDNVVEMNDKPVESDVMNTWGCACWSSRFTRFMHEFLNANRKPATEVVLASVFQAAMEDGLSFNGTFFEQGQYIDIGTPDDLVLTVRNFSQ